MFMSLNSTSFTSLKLISPSQGTRMLINGSNPILHIALQAYHFSIVKDIAVGSGQWNRRYQNRMGSEHDEIQNETVPQAKWEKNKGIVTQTCNPHHLTSWSHW